MSSREPVNIQRLVRENKRVAEAEAYAKSITKGSIVSGWHERHDKGPWDSCGLLQCLTSSSVPPEGTLSKATVKSDIQHEVLQGNRTVLQMRQARLEELMRQERLQYEAELNAMGLALTKHRG
eukprot:GHRR01014301.1.p1 GENE.GHRR01014301.1~~GHRR01014301.1.p1  ORF type:complete len:123 (+),score=11.07 GHRR01014301.1:271-639(+)